MILQNYHQFRGLSNLDLVLTPPIPRRDFHHSRLRTLFLHFAVSPSLPPPSFLPPALHRPDAPPSWAHWRWSLTHCPLSLKRHCLGWHSLAKYTGVHWRNSASQRIKNCELCCWRCAMSAFHCSALSLATKRTFTALFSSLIETVVCPTWKYLHGFFMQRLSYSVLKSKVYYLKKNLMLKNLVCGVRRGQDHHWGTWLTK